VGEMKITHGATTHSGQVRKENEDALLVEGRLYVVADGMGGHNAGEVASAMAIKSLQAAAGGIIDEASLNVALDKANEAIYEESMTNHVHHGMGTTIAALVMTDDSVVVGNIGDARIYRWHEGNLSRITKDHSYVQELVDEGIISLEEARVHPRRNIVTRALGIDGDVEASTSTLPITVGARYILCSDGLVDEVTDAEIAAILTRHSDSQAAADALVSAANAAGGRDNVTVIVVDVADGDAAMTETGAGEDGLSEASSESHRSAQRSSEEPPAPVVAETPPPSPTAAKRKFGVGVLLFWTGLVGIVLAVLVVFAAYGRTGYFVGYDGQDVVVYKGRPGGVLWFDPTVEAKTTLTEEDLTDELAEEIAGNPTFSNAASAQKYVNSVRDEVQPIPTTTLPEITTTTVPETTTSSSSTSTVADSVVESPTTTGQ
jgi:serine/threonine protein phosphatase PrpC